MAGGGAGQSGGLPGWGVGGLGGGGGGGGNPTLTIPLHTPCTLHHTLHPAPNTLHTKTETRNPEP